MEDRARLERFFAGLKPVLRIAEQAQRRLDLHAATAFSVFAYFREDELALSRIFADLLDPDGSHGQGERFLRDFIDMLDLRDAPTELGSCRVYLEHLTSQGRRIDIVLAFGGATPCWIGIENKPWASEPDRQLEHYIDELRSKANAQTAGWAMLYLKGTDRPPGTSGKYNLKDLEAKGRFRIVPYIGSRSAVSRSLETWLVRCRQECEAEKVRWFLGDVLAYIHKNFTAAESLDQKNEGLES